MIDAASISAALTFLLPGIPLTLGIAAASLAIGVALALPMALIRAARIPVAAPVVEAVTEFVRTTPPLLHIVWIYYVLPQLLGIRMTDLTVVVVALSMSVAAQMAETFRAGFEAIPRGQYEAAEVLGIGRLTRLRYVILPQLMRLILAPTASVIVSLIKDTSLAAIIAVPELMNLGQVLSAQTFRPLEVLTLVAVIYFVLTYPVALATGYLESRSRTAYRRN